MCYSAGSITVAVNPCPMCKVYPHPKCPHNRETCRNRANHPRMDVFYLTNAEVDRFNGCGFCKWAAAHPHSKGYANPGWPGCCRPPTPAEFPAIELVEWKAVSIVHSVPIPPDIDRVLAAMYLPPSRPPSTQPTSPAARASPSKTASPSATRKSSTSTPVKGSPSPQYRGRNLHPSGSPTANISRPPSSAAISASVPNPSSIEAASPRRKASATPDRRIQGTHSTHSSPSRKSLDLDSPLPHSSTSRRPALTPATTSVSVSKIVAADTRTPRDVSRRRSLVADASPPRSTTPPSPPSTAAASEAPRKDGFLVPRESRDALSSSASSSSGSSDGLGSITDSTVTSDAGFTDYLSDESEAELQRQAEARATVLAQTQAEELEFKMARQQLAGVGLKPPKSWNPTSTTPPRASAAANGARSHVGALASATAASFAGAATAILQGGQATRV